MYLNVPSTATILAILACSVAAVGPQGSRYMRDLRWAAEAGIDPQLILNNDRDIRALISHSPNAGQGPKPEYTALPIDHDDPSIGTFQNRFWVSEEFYVPGGPIFVFDAGESSGDVYLTHLTSNDSFFKQMLKDFNAMGVLWENRYYGGSRPFPIHFNMPPEQLQYLTTKQALEDLPQFAKTFSRPNYPDVDLRPESTPWIMVGGSYAGVRAAITRQEYPNTIYAAYASSAPVEAQIDFSTYFENVYRGMEANGLGNCLQNLQAALRYIDDQLDQEETASIVKRMFFGPGAENNTNEGFTAALVHQYDSFQDYGVSGPAGSSLQDLCSHLEDPSKTNQTAKGARDTLRHDGGKVAAERWASWSPLVSIVNYNMATNCKQLNTNISLSCNLSQPSFDPDMIAWSWQYCTEWGFYQSNNFGPHALLSKYQTLEYQQDICNRQFPEALKRGILPNEPAVDATNAQFGGWRIRPSNTFFSVGEFDPWTLQSVLSDSALTAENTAWSSNIPECGETDEDHIFAYKLKNSMHCFDFQPGKGQEANALFRAALGQWLPCFKGQGLSSGRS
ncbi:serine carboxypeptidase S28-domain-containing protein [Aspergillus ambiguus]|uniref:putative serine peptidase, family S28 n=1 Tax=Aspergillus ambiguus TaxID=176160 RepID=UPI003CCDC8C3